MIFNSAVPSMLTHTINKMSSDMKFVGIFYIVTGAFYCLSIIGAVVGIPLIISGLRVREAADSFVSFSVSGDTALLENALDRQTKFFFIQKVFMIITIVAMVAYVIFAIVFFSYFMNNFGSTQFPTT